MDTRFFCEITEVEVHNLIALEWEPFFLIIVSDYCEIIARFVSYCLTLAHLV